MAVRALLLTFVLALSVAPGAIAATSTGGTGTPQRQTGGFGSFPPGEPVAAQPAPTPGAEAQAVPSSAATSTPSAASARKAKAHRAQPKDDVVDVVDVPLPGSGSARQAAAPATSPAAGRLASTGFDLGLFTALGCLLTGLGLGLLALLGPRERF
jgi:hypothetical protein